MSIDKKRGSGKVASIILGAGYGTRLQKGIREDCSQEFLHLLGVPKPLLPVGRKLLIDYWIEDFKACPLVEETYVITNAHFYDSFKTWAVSTGFPVDNILNDGTTDNESRLGAISDINMVLEAKQIKSRGLDILIVAGDTLFYSDFSINAFLNSTVNTCRTVYYELKDPQEVTKRGIIETDVNGYITGFLEKPSLGQTTSKKACPALYYITNDAIPLVSEFLNEKKNAPLCERDAPGQLLAYIY
eukprot:Ihof_evm11s67 gene=Ihof_evmTU11s67